MSSEPFFTELLLASTSPARAALLGTLGIPFRVVAPEVDEDVVEGTPVAHAVAIIAERKARAVLAKFPTALVIGSDQLVNFQGQALGKPADLDAARRQLRALRGRNHEIATGLSVVGAGFVVSEVDISRLTMRQLTDELIEGYLATEEWKGCAGAYRIEAKGQTLFARIDGDRTSIQGLPMQRLVHTLWEANIRLF